MAKLTGINVINMTNGAITAIEYGGAAYSKVDDTAQAGDVLLRVKHELASATIGSFYVCVPELVSGLSARSTSYCGNDDFNVHGGASNFVVFRKASESPQASAPFAEMVVSRVEAVEKRMDALEGAKDTETLVKGDRVLISGRSIVGTDTDGKIGRYERISDVAGLLVVVDGTGRLFHREQLTKVAGTEALKIGDYAKVISLANGEPNTVVGDIILIRDMSADFIDYTVLRNGKLAGMYAKRFIKATDAEVAAALAPKVKPVSAPAQPKTGDIVVITANTNSSRNEVGDIGKLTEGRYVDVPQRPHSRGINGNFTRASEMRLATPAEIERYEAQVIQAAKDSVFTKAGRKPNEYRKGDVVRVLDTLGTTFLDVGQITEVINPQHTGGQDVRSNDGGTRYAKVEIVCFAENRADLAKGAC